MLRSIALSSPTCLVTVWRPPCRSTLQRSTLVSAANSITINIRTYHDRLQSQDSDRRTEHRIVTRRLFSLSSRRPTAPKESEENDGVKRNGLPPPKKPLRDTTRELRERVKTRLSTLTPHENIYTVPNVLTFSRLLAAPVVGYLVLHDQHAWAVGLFAYAGITDLVDGWIARRWNLQTVVGSVVDPMADKMLMTILVGCLAIKGAMPLWLATLILGRDVSLAIAAIYYRYASLPPPKTFTRYWDFSLPSAEVHPTTVSKFNTFLQIGLIGATTALPLVTSGALDSVLGGLNPSDVESAVRGLGYVVASTTLWSGASYAWNRKAVKILGSDEALKEKQGMRGRAVVGVSFAAVVGLAAWFAANEKSITTHSHESGAEE